MTANNNSQGSQGSYYSFSEMDVETWDPNDPNFLTSTEGQAYPPSSAYATTAPAYYPAPHAAAGYTTPEDPAISYDPQPSYDASYVRNSSSDQSWHPSPATTATTNPYLTPGSSDQVYTPLTSQTSVDPAAYGDQGTATWDPNSGSGYSTGYTTPQGNSARPTGFRCEYCPVPEKLYSRSRDLQRHIHSRHPEFENPAADSSEFVDCQYCGKRNMRKDNLKRHIEKKHPRYRDTSRIAPRH